MGGQTKRKARRRFLERCGILLLLCGVILVLGFSIKLLKHSLSSKNSVIASANTASVCATESTEAESSNSAQETRLELQASPSFLAVLEGNTASIAATVSATETGIEAADALLWSSSDTTIATVDATGTITGIQQGNCQITISIKEHPEATQSVPVYVRRLEEKEGCTYVDGILIVNKTYSLPEEFDPGELNDAAKTAFEQMQAAAMQEGLHLYIGSSYRDYQSQLQIYQNYCEQNGSEMADTFSARPGFSEHQTGLAIDCNTIDDAFGETPEAAWLSKHCAEYGFIIRFPKGKEGITGYQYEPWHIRYVGVETAKEITALDLTLEEYLGVSSAYAKAWTDMQG